MCAADRRILALEEGNNSRLVAPRRYGKTSLLRRLTEEMRSDGWEAVYVDFFGVLTLVRRPRRAFYAQARELALPPLADEDSAAFLDGRFAETGRAVGTALAPLLALASGHPQRTVLLAHALWEQTPAGETADEATFAAALAQTMSELLSEFQGVWSALPTGQRRVLAQIADNTAGLYAVRAAGGRGGSVGSALATLVDRGEVVPDPTGRTGHRVVDPLLALWVREGRPQTWPAA